MKNIGIFYGSATGTTADIAQKIGRLLGVAPEDIHDVSEVAPSVFGQYGTLVLGSSTWGNGELEDDWYDFIDGAQALDLKGHKIALFGCGDQTMADTFCNAVGILYDRLRGTGATFIGEFPADGYSFSHSDAKTGDTMRGLVLDQVNHPEFTPARLAAWTDQVRQQAQA